MNIKTLFIYINTCKIIGIEPTFEGLNKLNKAIKGGK